MSLAKDTLILRADGSVMPASLITVGDCLLGPDSTSRNVVTVKTGRDSLYQIRPRKGEPWVCGTLHVLALVKSSVKRTGVERPSSKAVDILEIPFNDWHASSPWLQQDLKQFSVGITNYHNNFNAPDSRPIDPYFLGVWFGDGTKTTRDLVNGTAINGVFITKPDPEILSLCNEQARIWGLHVRTHTDYHGCPTHALAGSISGPQHDNNLLRTLRNLVGPEIKIPEAYLHGPREERLQFLAGLLDTDGGLDWTKTTFFITQKREDWARAPWRLARSLGFYAGIRSHRSRWKRADGTVFEGDYWTVTISGDTDQIPTRIPRKRAQPRKQIKRATRTSFVAAPIGEGDCYAFTLDKDGRFLLGDFTVCATRRDLVSS